MNCAVVWFIYLWISYTRAGRHSAQTTIGSPSLCVSVCNYLVVCRGAHAHVFVYGS